MNSLLNQMLVETRTADFRREAVAQRRAAELRHQRPDTAPGGAAAVTIRAAYADDELELCRLAIMDGTDRVPAGAVVVAEVDGAIRAALGAGGDVISDPFFPAGELVELLRLRARQADPPRRRSGGYLTRARAALQHTSRRQGTRAGCA